MRAILGLSATSLLFALAACGSDATPFTAGGTGGILTGAGAGPTTGSGNGSGTGSGGGGGGGGGLGSGSGGGGASGTGSGLVDADGDGLDDAWENTIAASYLPFLSIDPADGCPRGGILFRVRPHPENPALLNIIYDHLFEKDCGLTGHVGDDEVFGVTVDPTIPAPEGILVVRAVTHQGTICEKTTMCGVCGGMKACETASKGGKPYPVVRSSKDKHASYVEKDQCNPIIACLDTCGLASKSDEPPMVNAGEPDKPLLSNLTTEGFINQTNGWTEQDLFDFDPWDPQKDFGGAGNIASDLQDAAFVPPVCP